MKCEKFILFLTRMSFKLIKPSHLDVIAILLYTHPKCDLNKSFSSRHVTKSFLKFNFVYLKRSRAHRFSSCYIFSFLSQPSKIPRSFFIKFPLPMFSLSILLFNSHTQKKWQTNLKYWFCGRLFIENSLLFFFFLRYTISRHAREIYSGKMT